MKEPKHAPGTWIVFKMEDGGAFGKISGGNYTEEGGWVYQVENLSTPEKYITVAEVDITAESDGGKWILIG